MTPPNAPTAAEVIERCAKRHPKYDWQCGLWVGHDGEHNALIPSNLPWATHRVRQDGQLPATDTPAETRRGIYIASRTRHAAWWRALRDDGCPIISSWIDEAGIGQTADWQGLWDRCVAEAANAAALIVYAEQADRYLKGALVEVGAALSHGVPVYLVMSDRNVAGSAWNHRLVTECESFDDALALALAHTLAAVPPGETSGE